MASVKDLYAYIDTLAQFDTQEGFDNAGFLVGHADKQVTDVLVCLDITLPVIQEAMELGAQLIVAHHPVIFTPVRSITDESVVGRRLLLLTEAGIGAICAHTNLDASQDGVNDVLARTLGLAEIRQLHRSGIDGQGREYGIGRIGHMTNTELQEASRFAEHVKAALHAGCVRYHDAGRTVYHVAVGGGSCGNMLPDVVAAGCDTFVTSDIKHDIFVDAADYGINLIDAGHFATEDVICQPLADALQTAFPQLHVVKSKICGEVFSCL